MNNDEAKTDEGDGNNESGKKYRKPFIVTFPWK